MKIQELPDDDRKERLRRHIGKIISLRSEAEQHRLVYDARIRQVRVAQESSAKWIKDAYDLTDSVQNIVDSISEDGKELAL